MRGTLVFIITMLLFSPGSPLGSESMALEKKVIIGFRQQPGDAEQNLVKAKRGKIHRNFKKFKILAATLPEDDLIKLRSDPRIAYIESDATVQAVESFTGAEYDMAWGVRQINGQICHQNSFMGSGVKIAVLDTGIDYNHPELAGNYQGGIDLVYGDDDPMDDSRNSHGTHLAGIIAAELNDSGVVGVAPQSALYAVKVLNGGGMGTLSDVIAGIEWAMDNGMDIVNLSLGIAEDYQSLHQACDQAYQSGILLIAAAGNTSGNPAVFPAIYESVVAVNGTDASDNASWFSAIDSAVELAAPGTSIVSTTTGDSYTSLDGTSQAAAHVTGAAALLIAAGTEDLNGDGQIADEVRLRLQSSAVDLGLPGPDDHFGFGRVDVAQALMLSESDPEPSLEEPIIIDIQREERKKKFSLSANHYQVSIINNGLKRLKIVFYDDNGRRSGPGKTIVFTGANRQGTSFALDLTGASNTMALTPAGPKRSSARITLLPSAQNISSTDSPVQGHQKKTTVGNKLPLLTGR
ncbi:MAG: hypothetical protein A2X84_01150 [Desulfuromonadaceae bacterium GWC2_58_13]|nr:MAG: hypothetical protein A2X84_01150 [Desulfuromonadaceae bacterium GWC2_58_13]